MLSTHWREPRAPSASELRNLDVLARQAADLIDRKNAEAALKAERQRLETVLQQLPQGVIIAEAPSGKLVLSNAQVARIWRHEHFTSQEILGYEHYTGFYPDGGMYAPSEWPLARTIAKGEIIEQEEIQFQRQDGSLGWMSVNASPIRDEKHNVIAGVVTFADISERKRTEEALRTSEERYRTLFESIDQGFCIIQVLFDADERPVDYCFLETNPAFQVHTGLHDVAGKRMRELAPFHEEHWFETYGRVATAGQPERFTEKAEHLNNRWYDVYTFRIGPPWERKVAVLFNDITNQKKAEESLRQLNETLEQRVIERTELAEAGPGSFRRWRSS